MAISDISLTEGMRRSLLSLQETSSLMSRTTERLSTGKDVNSAIDDPIAYFAALTHTQRASDLSLRKDGMSEAIQTIKAADNGIDSISGLLQQARGIVTIARTTDAADTTTLTSLSDQFNELRAQIDFMVDDAAYGGTNLLTSGTLTVLFDETGTSQLVVQGTNAYALAGLGIASATGSAWTGSALSSAETQLTAALESLRTDAQTMASNLSIISARQDFTTNMMETLQTGADNLTLADLNEESANMLMLQTRQQLGISSLGMATEEAQALLSLF